MKYKTVTPQKLRSGQILSYQGKIFGILMTNSVINVDGQLEKKRYEYKVHIQSTRKQHVIPGNIDSSG